MKPILLVRLKSYNKFKIKLICKITFLMSQEIFVNGIFQFCFGYIREIKIHVYAKWPT